MALSIGSASESQFVDREESKSSPTEQQWGTGLGDLSEACIAYVLCYTSPKDVLRLACVSRAFREAALSDSVWNTFLPSHYLKALSSACTGIPYNKSKKEIFDVLCGGVPLSNFTQTYRLDRETQAVSYHASARALRIVWVEDPRYWKWVWATIAGARSHEVAYLNCVCWLEVRGKLDCVLPPGSYKLCWRYFIDPSAGRGFENSRHYKPVKFSLQTNDGQHAEAEHFLMKANGLLAGQRLVLPENRPNRMPVLQSVQEVCTEEGHLSNIDWMELEVGEFTVQSDDACVTIDFSMLETEGGFWKYGLYLDSVSIRPSSIHL